MPMLMQKRAGTRFNAVAYLTVDAHALWRYINERITRYAGSDLETS